MYSVVISVTVVPTGVLVVTGDTGVLDAVAYEVSVIEETVLTVEVVR